MASSTNSFSGQLVAEDVNGIKFVNRAFGPIELAGTDGQITLGSLTDTSAHSQTFPSMITTASNYFFQNTHATATITVTWTHTTGASAVVQAVSPGGCIGFWNTTVTSPGGITALSLTSDTAGATFIQFIGG